MIFVVFCSARLEEKAEHFESALAIVQRGLQEIPRYGPLWFGAFRLSEKLGELKRVSMCLVGIICGRV